jgi:hypothetical protein
MKKGFAQKPTSVFSNRGGWLAANVKPNFLAGRKNQPGEEKPPTFSPNPSKSSKG